MSLGDFSVGPKASSLRNFVSVSQVPYKDIKRPDSFVSTFLFGFFVCGFFFVNSQAVGSNLLSYVPCFAFS